jgi:hypothetical protein
VKTATTDKVLFPKRCKEAGVGVSTSRPDQTGDLSFLVAVTRSDDEDFFNYKAPGGTRLWAATTIRSGTETGGGGNLPGHRPSQPTAGTPN